MDSINRAGFQTKIVGRPEVKVQSHTGVVARDQKTGQYKARKWKFKAFVALVLIIATIYGVTRPAVSLFLHTAHIYTSGGLQKKAWNEAQRQYLEQQLKDSQKQLDTVKPQSFYEAPGFVPTAKAAELPPRPELNSRVQAYLESKNSPLARYTDLLLEQKNWQRIISISNAESSMCLRVSANVATNCWGLGGSKLWDLGDTFEEAIPAIELALETQPAKAKVKYADMTIAQMNGIWNQPKTTSWIANNSVVLEELAKLTK